MYGLQTSGLPSHSVVQKLGPTMGSAGIPRLKKRSNIFLFTYIIAIFLFMKIQHKAWMLIIMKCTQSDNTIFTIAIIKGYNHVQ